MWPDHGTAQHEPVLAGTRRRSGDEVPRAGTWEIVDHRGCRADGLLRALAPGSAAPPCPVCDGPVTWQLSHLAPSVAADHRNVGHLP